MGYRRVTQGRYTGLGGHRVAVSGVVRLDLIFVDRPLQWLSVDRGLSEPLVAVENLMCEAIRTVPMALKASVGAVGGRRESVYVVSNGVRRGATKLVGFFGGLASDTVGGSSGAFLQLEEVVGL